MVFKAGRGIKVVALLVKSILRHNTHLILLVSLIALLLLTVILYSLPSPVLLLENYSNNVLNDVNVVVASREGTSETCIEVRVVEAELAGYGSTILVHPEAITERFWGILKFNETECMCNGLTVSLPRNLYASLNYTCKVELKTGGAYRNYCVRYTHELLEAVVILANYVESFQGGNLYLCLTSKLEITRSTLVELENSILNTVDMWLLLLLTTSLPGVYIASTRVLLSIKNELKVLLDTGLSETTITLYCTMALWILEAFSALFLLSLSIVIVYSASTVFSTIAPVLIPALRPARILRLTLLIFMSTFLVFLIASRRFAKNGGLL